jgi:hypothetical protein
MTRRIAHEALIALEFHGLPLHDPFHGHAVGRRWPPRDQGRICSGRDALQGAGIWRAAVRCGRGTVVRSTSRRWVMSTTTHISSVSGAPARLADQVKSSLSRVISRVPTSLVSKSVSHCALWPAALWVMSPPTQVTGAALIIRSPFAHPTGDEPAMAADGFTDGSGSGSALATCGCFHDRTRQSRSIPRISRALKV